MSVVHTVNSLRADPGGPSRSVTALCTHLARAGETVELVAYRGREGEPAPVLPGGEVVVRLAEPEPAWRALASRRSAFAESIAASAGVELLHDHGLWLPSNVAAARVARRLRVPFVVSTRGMLTRWALSQSPTKKRLAWDLYQERALRSTALLHATSEDEVEDIRRADLTQPIVVLPNGVEVPGAARARMSGSPRRALFLSRLHPGKGLLNLVEAWARVRPAGWELVLAGPDEGGHRAEVEAKARALGVDDLRFAGEVDDRAKWNLYRSADLFVLPTFSENFGIVVAEALAAGVPAITTTGAPWRDLETHRCGWWVDLGVEPLAVALCEATALDDEARAGMGARGRALIEQNYSWAYVAEQMRAAYAWLRGRGDRPDCVVD